MIFRLLYLSRNGQFSVLEIDLNVVVCNARKLEECCYNILLLGYAQSGSLYTVSVGFGNFLSSCPITTIIRLTRYVMIV